MSGIAAVFRRDGRNVSARELDGVARALSLYGRAYQTVECLGPVGFAYSHFPNVPEAINERQPVSGGNQRFALVFDGRLDNRDELADSLHLDKDRSSTMPDSALVMSAWEKWSTLVPCHLVGEFATIVWDAKEQTLFAFRDHFGSRTLCYFESNDLLVVASAPKAIFSLPEIAREVDPQKIADVLGDFYHDGSRTFYRNISRIPPAHTLRCTRTALELRRYWTLQPGPEIRYKSDGEYVEAAAELLSRAVKVRLRRIGKVGAEMTGGFDSSSVAVTALEHLGPDERLPVFTCVPQNTWDGRCPEGRYGDEKPLVEAIARKHPRLQPIYIEARLRSYDDGIEDFFRAAEVVNRSPICLPYALEVMEEAKQLGISTILNGNWGNMSLSWSGAGAYTDWLRQGQLLTLLRELRLATQSPFGFLRKAVGRAILPAGPEWLSEYIWSIYLRVVEPAYNGPRWARFSPINNAFARKMRIQERAAKFGFNYYGRPPSCTRALRISVLTTDCALENGDACQGLRALSGIEYRDPFIDLRLVEWCLSIPEEQYLRNGEERWLVKRLMKNRLPDEVLFNRKRGMLAADWHARLTPHLGRLKDDLEVLAEDPETANMLDTERLLTALESWPHETPISNRDDRRFFLPRCLPHAVATGRFVRWVKGANR